MKISNSLPPLLATLLLAHCSGPVSPEPAASEAGVVLTQEAEMIRVSIDGRPFTAFQYETEWPKPFLHPLVTDSGIVISRGFPLETIEGESDDRPWHRGIIFGHGDINGVDFWRETGPEAAGRLVPSSPPAISSADTITSNLDLVTPDDSILGSVSEEFRFSTSGTHRIIDALITVSADREIALKMGDTEDGGFGVRLKDEFREDRGATLLNSDGLTGTGAIWGQRAKWVDYSATREGKRLGVAIFDHPANPKHPTYWHARGYGLNTANPYGEHDFHGDDARDGSVTIPAGGKLVFRYRVVIHEGDAGEAGVEALYAAYAEAE